jgi:threonine synthase
MLRASSVKYISTRGQAPELNFEEVTLAGLASDGGLYLPKALPSWSTADLKALRTKDYVETALWVLRPFVGTCLAEAKLKAILQESYKNFSHTAIAPLVQVDHQHWLLELFHGPTLAFKDFALQVLGLLFEHFLTKRSEHVTVVGATSGDTGSAAIQALAGRDNLDIFMLHPLGRVSDVQRRQMTTVMAPNVHNIALEGTFDDAQALVKAMFNDAAFRERRRLSAVNSINWTRLLVQIVYYVYAAVRLGAPERPVVFSVPTGNFGDVFAGYLAAQMGLPIERLLVATNVNDILHRALSQGDYSVGSVVATSAPSMDIQVSSNFERLLFDLYGRDGAALGQAMQTFQSHKSLILPEHARAQAAKFFYSFRADEDETALTLRQVYEKTGQIIDPHTAIGMAAARAYARKTDAAIVTLATAHPAKFRDAVERATGVRPGLPARLGGLFSREERMERMPNDLKALQHWIDARMALEVNV